MPGKRIVEVESESSAIWWGLGGVAIGAIAGILIAEKLSGKRMHRGTLMRTVRQIARLVGGKWQPLLAAAMGLRDVWVARRAGKIDESEFEPDDDFDGEYEAEALDDEAEEMEGLFDGDDEADDEADDEFEESDDEDEGSEIGRRVLEAFMNDPVLMERSVEIDADESGRVVLHGDVRTSREIAHAVTIAGGVPGVTGVRQRLSVRIRR